MILRPGSIMNLSASPLFGNWSGIRTLNELLLWPITLPTVLFDIVPNVPTDSTFIFSKSRIQIVITISLYSMGSSYIKLYNFAVFNFVLVFRYVFLVTNPEPVWRTNLREGYRLRSRFQLKRCKQCDQIAKLFVQCLDI